MIWVIETLVPCIDLETSLFYSMYKISIYYTYVLCVEKKFSLVYNFVYVFHINFNTNIKPRKLILMRRLTITKIIFCKINLCLQSIDYLIIKEDFIWLISLLDLQLMITSIRLTVDDYFIKLTANWLLLLDLQLMITFIRLTADDYFY